MSGTDEILKLLTEIRDQQKLSLQRQEEHLAVAREQMDRAKNQIEESMALQRHAMDRFKKLSRVVLPAILLCVALILYLMVRYL